MNSQQFEQFEQDLAASQFETAGLRCGIESALKGELDTYHAGNNWANPALSVEDRMVLLIRSVEREAFSRGRRSIIGRFRELLS